MTLVPCHQCNGKGELPLDGKEFKCHSCYGSGTLCNLCWEPPGVCECPGEVPTCEVCGKVKVACKCGETK